MKMYRSSLRAALVLGACLLVPAVSMAAYAVILKDGTRIVAKERFKVQGDLAIITLENGTVTQIQLSKVDVGASDRQSAQGVGGAVPLDSGTPTSTKPANGGRDGSSPSLLEVAKRAKLRDEQRKKAEASMKTGSKGVSTALIPYPERDVANAFFADLEKAGLANITTWAGSEKGALRIDLTADSETQVFAALQAIGKKYQDMKGSTSLAPDRIELNMKTTTGEDAGSFSFDIGQIAPLLRGELSPPEFYVRNVVL